MTSMDAIIEGFAILRSYDEASSREVNTDHDTLWAGSEDFGLDDYTAQDRARLEELGWHFDDNIDRWAIYT